jgi:hypothetical protein
MGALEHQLTFIASSSTATKQGPTMIDSKLKSSIAHEQMMNLFANIGSIMYGLWLIILNCIKYKNIFYI